MPYEHRTPKGTYVLYTRDVELKGGRKQTIYFFSKKGNHPREGNPSEIPPGKVVKVNARTGLPFLANDHEDMRHALRSRSKGQEEAPDQGTNPSQDIHDKQVTNESDPRKNRPNQTIRANITESTRSDRPSSEDLLGFTPYVRGLSRFLASDKTKPPLSVSIEGEWGAGKSSFLKQLNHQIQLDDPECIVFWFNPWKHQTKTSLWASFALTAMDAVIDQTSKKVKRRKNWKFWWKANRPDPWKAGAAILGSTAVATAAYAALESLPNVWQGLGASSLPVGALLAYGSKRVARLEEPVQWSIQQHVTKGYEGYLDFQARFNADFSDILHQYAQERRIFAIVDDLDRCSPAQAAQLMEAMHHLTADNSDIIFVMGIDYDKVAAGLGHRHMEGLGAQSHDWKDYSQESIRKGRHHLEKLIQLRFIVPRSGTEQIRQLVTSDRKGAEVVVEKDNAIEIERPHTQKVPDIELDEQKESEFVLEQVTRVAPSLDFNPRRVLHFLNAFRLQCALAKELSLFEQGIRPAQVATWTVLATRHPLALKVIQDDPDLLGWITEIAGTDQATGEDVPENVRQLLLDRSLTTLLVSHDEMGESESFDINFVDRMAKLNPMQTLTLQSEDGDELVA